MLFYYYYLFHLLVNKIMMIHNGMFFFHSEHKWKNYYYLVVTVLVRFFCIFFFYEKFGQIMFLCVYIQKSVFKYQTVILSIDYGDISFILLYYCCVCYFYMRVNHLHTHNTHMCVGVYFSPIMIIMMMKKLSNTNTMPN